MAALSWTAFSSASNSSHKDQQGTAATESAAKQNDTKLPLLPNPVSTSATWVIHERKYRMAEFVPYHPGGLETIMLGCGHDCTALFESYHPFTHEPRRILEQYLVHDKDVTAKEIPVAATTETKDVFYETMRLRVEQTLRAQGLDPVKDRAASWPRFFYYVFVLALVAVTGVAHARVRTYIHMFMHIRGVKSRLHCVFS
jgi:hypothetical protein